MRIPSGSTDLYAYVVAVDSTDYVTPETGLAGKMVVTRSRNGGAAATYVTPTINETDTGLMTGVYEILIDEDTTLGAGNLSEEYIIHVRDTGGHMAPLSRVFEIYDPDTGGGLGTVSANITQINGDTGAAHNLGDMYNGTGYFAETAPASRIQVFQRRSSSAVVNFFAEDDNVDGAINGVTFAGIQTTGTYLSTHNADGSEHQLTEFSNDLDIVYQFDMSGPYQSANLTFLGRLDPSNLMRVQAFDFDAGSWETRDTLTGRTGVDNEFIQLPLSAKHTGDTGNHVDKVYIRIAEDTNPQTGSSLYVEELLVGGIPKLSANYQDGAIYIDTGVPANTETRSHRDGTADNPVTTLAAARTLADNLNLRRFRILSDSTFQLTQDFRNFTFQGDKYTVDLNYQYVHGSRFVGGTILTGDVGVQNVVAVYDECVISDVRMGGGTAFEYCVLTGTDTGVQLVDPGEHTFISCYAEADTGTAPVIRFQPAIVQQMYLKDWNGPIRIEGMDAGHTLHIQGSGHIIEGSTVIAGTPVIRGNFEFSGITNLTIDNSNLTTPGAVWDQVDTGHTDTGTFGRLRQGVNISKVNDVVVIGDGSSSNTWGPDT